MTGLRFSHRLVLALLAGACDSEPAAVRTLPGVNISVTPVTLILPVGATAPLAATVRDPGGDILTGHDIQWSSSAPAVAEVSTSGLVTAIAPGVANIGAYSGQSVGFARVVVQIDFRLPVVAARSVLRAEIGTPTAGCPAGEGGLRAGGGRDCSHAGISRYSLDFRPAPEHPTATAVGAAADGTVSDVCLQPPAEVTCGPNGPFVYIEHGSGFATFYSHLDPGSVSVRRKTRVTQDQPLGTMGAWGADPYPWVHFELRLNSRNSDQGRILEDLLVEGRKLTEYRVDQ